MRLQTHLIFKAQTNLTESSTNDTGKEQPGYISSPGKPGNTNITIRTGERYNYRTDTVTSLIR